MRGRINEPTDPGPDDDSFWPWLAGFIDGEGSVGWTTAKRYPCPYVSISQHERSRDVLEEILARCGGSIHVTRNDGFRTSGTQLVLGIRSQSGVRRVLENTLPYLRIKGERAKEVLRLLDEIPTGERYGRPWTEIELAYLKRHAYSISFAEIAVRLRRTEQAVTRKANILWRNGPPPQRICPLCGGWVTGNRLRIFCCREHGREWELLAQKKRLTPEQIERRQSVDAARSIA